MWHLFWVIPVFGGSIAAGLRELGEVNERRAERAQERGRLRRAQKLLSVAEDGAASAAERQQAVVRARAELDGLIVLPRRTVAAIERRAAGECPPDLVGQWQACCIRLMPPPPQSCSTAPAR